MKGWHIIASDKKQKSQGARKPRAKPANPARKPFTQDEREAIARDLRDVKVIACEYGCAVNTVKKHQRRKKILGWINPRRRGNTMLDSERQINILSNALTAVMESWRQGFSVAEDGSVYDAGKSALHSTLEYWKQEAIRMSWVDRKDMMPELIHADENGRVWASDGLRVVVVKLSEFEHGNYAHWQPRPRRAKPSLPEKLR